MELACAVVAATGRGYACSHKADDPDGPYTDRLASFDTATDDSKFPFDTLFHRLGVTAEALQTYVEGNDQVANWLRDTEEETIDLLRSLAVKHVEEALTTWESLEVTHIANLMLPDLLQQAKEINFTKLQHLALKMGFELIPASCPLAPALADSGPPTQPPPQSTTPHAKGTNMNAIMLAVQMVIVPLMSRLESIEKASASPQGLTLPAMRHFTHTHEPHTQEVNREHNPQSWPQQSPMELESGPAKAPEVSPVAPQPTNRHTGQGDECQTVPPHQ